MCVCVCALGITVGSIESLMVFALVYFFFFHSFFGQISHRCWGQIGRTSISFFYFYKTAVTHRDGQHALQNQLNAFNISIHEARNLIPSIGGVHAHFGSFSELLYRKNTFLKGRKNINNKNHISPILYGIITITAGRERERERLFFLYNSRRTLELCGNSPPITIFGCLFSVLITGQFLM